MFRSPAVDPQDPVRAGVVAVTGAIIAGGAGRRMGIDKRGLIVEGVPLLRRVADVLAEVVDEIIVACRPESPPEPGLLAGLEVRLVFDRLVDAGPLAGLESALREARNDLVVVVAGDMPWVAPEILRLLLAEARRRPSASCVALRTERGLEPLLAVYRRSTLAQVTGLLASGQRRMHALLDALEPAEVGLEAWHRADPSGRTALNLNDPADLARLEARLA
ncbi:MAG: molybdenum cofactor guanylyltransferase [Candidatus Limnocylindrales bacterium]